MSGGAVPVPPSQPGQAGGREGHCLLTMPTQMFLLWHVEKKVGSLAACLEGPTQPCHPLTVHCPNVFPACPALPFITSRHLSGHMRKNEREESSSSFACFELKRGEKRERCLFCSPFLFRLPAFSSIHHLPVHVLPSSFRRFCLVLFALFPVMSRFCFEVVFCFVLRGERNNSAKVVESYSSRFQRCPVLARYAPMVMSIPFSSSSVS